MTMKKQIFIVSFGVLALVTFCHSLALTTFGKSNTNNAPAYPINQNDKENSQQPRARKCASDSECAAIRDTSCLEPVFSQKDGEKRCLCGDYREPRNGACENEHKSARVLCSDSSECTQGAQCLRSNNTSLPGNRCWCMQGFEEDDEMLCSGSPYSIGFSALSLVAGLLLAGNV